MKNTMKLPSYNLCSETVLEDSQGNSYKVYLKGYRVMLAKDARTGKFVKLSLVQQLFDRIERLKAFLALAFCVLANVFAFSYLALA